jgi:hypothetical protein
MLLARLFFSFVVVEILLHILLYVLVDRGQEGADREV